MIWLHDCPRVVDNYGPQVVEKGKQCPFCGMKEEEKYIGDRIDEKCPKCGADMLGNKVGDKWCSMVGCDYGMKDEEMTAGKG